MIKCVVFDLDGVLCDLVNAHRKAFDRALFSVCGYTIGEEEFWRYYNGIPSDVKLGMLVNRGILEPKYKQKVWDLKQEYTVGEIQKLTVDESKKVLHSNLKKDGFLLACVSNSIYKTIELALKTTKQLEYMDLILSNEDFGAKPKPNPFCYILAMEKLGLQKDETLIVEDSEKGLTAAYKSGAFVLEVKDSTEVTYERVKTKIENINNKEN